MTRGLGGKAPANIQHYLKGISYPANKNQLISTARSNKAPQEVLEAIQDLPAQDFGGPQDVMKAYGELSEEQRKAS